ncbi:right-handed parallel beta-helix repeat-containing protein [Candidatus Parcubacteria bacterium]|nr:MAG: right-handed parallel beta-helix repeat-containing protein [Candidatus Parcubacteria bacterium]
MLGFAAPVLAADCGGAVPCDCGDTLVDDRTLTEDDLVTHGQCPGNGLVIATDDIDLDLNDRTISGSGSGAGVRIEGAEGVTVANGKIRGFFRGIDATNPAPNASQSVFEDLKITDNDEDGIKVEGNNNLLRKVKSTSNGRHGINVVGGNNFIKNSRADENEQVGIKLQGNGKLKDNTAKKNGGKGIDAPGAQDGGGNKCKKNGGTGTIGGTPC